MQRNIYLKKRRKVVAIHIYASYIPCTDYADDINHVHKSHFIDLKSFRGYLPTYLPTYLVTYIHSEAFNAYFLLDSRRIGALFTSIHRYSSEDAHKLASIAILNDRGKAHTLNYMCIPDKEMPLGRKVGRSNKRHNALI